MAKANFRMQFLPSFWGIFLAGCYALASLSWSAFSCAGCCPVGLERPEGLCDLDIFFLVGKPGA